MKTDKEIWQEKFKKKFMVNEFKVMPGPALKLPEDKEEQKTVLEKVKFWNKEESNNKSLENRVEALEKELEKIKKYLNFQSRNTKKPQLQDPISQQNKETNETESK